MMLCSNCKKPNEKLLSKLKDNEGNKLFLCNICEKKELNKRDICIICKKRKINRELDSWLCFYCEDNLYETQQEKMREQGEVVV